MQAGNPDNDKNLERWKSSKVRAILPCTKAIGGLGLTLVAAEEMIIFNNAWNRKFNFCRYLVFVNCLLPTAAVDLQVEDRIHRIGQTRDVKTHFITGRYAFVYIV
jgi:hypothetical protein